MKLGLVVLGACVVGGTLGLLAAAPWQDAKAKEKPAAGAGAPFSPEEMAAWKKAMTPGPQQAEMAKLAGTWTVEARSWMKPGAPAEEWSGVSKLELDMGGRHLTEDFSGTMSMGPYHGLGLLAYDNAAGEWQHVWRDDMSTGLMFSRGESRDGAVTLHSSGICPANGKSVSMRMVMKSITPDERTVEMWSSFDGEPEFQSMSLRYTRSGSTPAGAQNPR